MLVDMLKQATSLPAATIITGACAFIVFDVIRRRSKAAFDFTSYPLGLHKDPPKPHHVLHLPVNSDPIGTFLSLLPAPSRTVTTTIKKQTPARLRLHGVDKITIGSTLSFRAHFSPLHSHQGGGILSLPKSLMRYFVAWNMQGTIVTFHRGASGPVAWAHIIRKGQALRLMWFYSNSTSKQYNLWFASLTVALFLASKEGLTIDLGPGGRTKATKEKFGFLESVDWAKSYSGMYEACGGGFDAAREYLLGRRKS